MKRNLCLVPTVKMGNSLWILLDPSEKLIQQELDDDSSAIYRSHEIVEEFFGHLILQENCNLFTYLGEIEHNFQNYTIVQYDLPKNLPWNYSKKYVRFDLNLKEFFRLNPTDSVNHRDSFLLAIGFKLLSRLK